MEILLFVLFVTHALAAPTTWTSTTSTDVSRAIWTYTSRNGLDASSPRLGADGTVLYIATGSTNLLAITQEGKLKWSFNCNPDGVEGGDVYNRPVVGTDGTIYVASNDGYLYAVTAEGNLTWRFNV